MFGLVLLFAAQSVRGSYCVPTDGSGEDFTASAILGGASHWCVVTEDKESKCWGSNHYGELGNGGAAWSMSNDEVGVPSTLWDGEFQYVSANFAVATYALMTDGTVQAVGGMNAEILCQEDADTLSVTTPVTVKLGSHSVKELHTGLSYSCIVDQDDKYYCWGLNGVAQLGLEHKRHIGANPGECGDNLVETNYGTGITVKHHRLGPQMQCIHTDDNRVKCWGKNNSGKLGIGISDSTYGGSAGQMGDNLPFVDLGDYVPKQVFPMGQNVCIWTVDDKVVCWGKAGGGQLGTGVSSPDVGRNPSDMGNNLQPVIFPTGKYPIDVDCGSKHCCAILSDKSVVCWGSCMYQVCGQEAGYDNQFIGDSPDEVGDNFRPIDFTGFDSPPKKLKSGLYGQCVTFEDETIACWGPGNARQLGNDYGGNGRDSPTPVLINPGATVATTCAAGSGGGSPQASVAKPRGKTFCYRFLDMDMKMADLNFYLETFEGGDIEPMTCVMKQLSKDWPHALTGPEPNQKHRRPQLRFEAQGGITSNLQERRKTRRGFFKKKCYTAAAWPSVSFGFEVAENIRSDSNWCNPCADVKLYQTTESEDGGITQLEMNLECKVFYGTDNKGRAENEKCTTPQGIKCRKGAYTLFAGTEDERNVNYGGMRCSPAADYTDDKWKVCA